MNDVISAFIDNEPFDPNELASALARSDGRELLLDLIALREITQPDETVPVLNARAKRRMAMFWVAAAASVMIASIGGYQLGVRERASPMKAPQPSVVVAAPLWEEGPSGGTR